MVREAMLEMAILQIPNLAGFLLPHSHIYKIRFFLFVLYQLSYLPMMGRVRFELTTPDFTDQRNTFAVRILMAVPRRIELRSLDRQSSIMATIRWNYT